MCVHELKHYRDSFDKINHWILFKKLITRRVPIYLVKVLCFWYQNRSMYIKWGSTFSGKFHVTNGVRQGGVLSPLLFNVYVSELSDCLNKSGIGGSMFVSRGIPTFAELLRTSIYRFAQRIEHSSNHIISATLLPLMHIPHRSENGGIAFSMSNTPV